VEYTGALNLLGILLVTDAFSFALMELSCR
jgi:hypothetical protein